MDPNNVLRMSHSSEALFPKSPHRPNRDLRSATRNNQLEPNEFFGNVNESVYDDDATSRATSIEFGPSNTDDPNQGFYDDGEDDEEFDPMLNIVTPDF